MHLVVASDSGLQCLEPAPFIQPEHPVISSDGMAIWDSSQARVWCSFDDSEGIHDALFTGVDVAAAVSG